MARVWISIGALTGLLTVALGAFGGHGLRGMVDAERLAIWETATHYMGLHALALLACGLLLLSRRGIRLIVLAAWAFLTGTLLFSGSLFLLAISGERAWGAITPLGGITLILAWALLAAGAWRALPGDGRDREGR